jgi:Zn finger protein HypA/HybF involved in hydrogenase expression
LRAEIKIEYHHRRMSCRKGKSKAKPKKGRYECDDCGAVVKKKSDVCDPKKLKAKKKK